MGNVNKIMNKNEQRPFPEKGKGLNFIQTIVWQTVEFWFWHGSQN
jgi:hypothetical protein